MTDTRARASWIDMRTYTEAFDEAINSLRALAADRPCDPQEVQQRVRAVADQVGVLGDMARTARQNRKRRIERLHAGRQAAAHGAEAALAAAERCHIGQVREHVLDAIGVVRVGEGPTPDLAGARRDLEAARALWIQATS